MYVPEPTNIPIEKTNHREYNELEVPVWPTLSENDIVHIHRGKLYFIQTPLSDIMSQTLCKLAPHTHIKALFTPKNHSKENY